MYKSDVNFLRSHPIPLVVLGHNLSLIWGSLIKLAGPGAPGTRLSLPSQFWNYKHAPLHLAISSTGCRDGTKVLLLSGQALAVWAIPLVSGYKWSSVNGSPGYTVLEDFGGSKQETTVGCAFLCSL